MAMPLTDTWDKEEDIDFSNEDGEREISAKLAKFADYVLDNLSSTL